MFPPTPDAIIVGRVACILEEAHLERTRTASLGAFGAPHKGFEFLSTTYRHWWKRSTKKPGGEAGLREAAFLAYIIPRSAIEVTTRSPTTR